MNLEYYESQAKLFKALNHPARLAILDILREGEACVCHMEAILKVRQAYLSQQLMTLREAGLVRDRRDGLNIFYRVSEPGIFAVIDSTGGLAETRGGADRAKLATQSGNITCSCPNCRDEGSALGAQG